MEPIPETGRRASDMAGGIPEQDISALFLTAVNNLSSKFEGMAREFGVMTEQIKNLAQDQNDTKDHDRRITALETRVVVLQWVFTVAIPIAAILAALWPRK